MLLRALSVALLLLLAVGAVGAPLAFEVPLEVTRYPLPYVQVTIGGREYRASIDTGSFRGVELSSTLARQLALPLETTTTSARRQSGKEFFLQKGRLPALKVGGWEGKDVEFGVAEGDIEAIAEQVKTPFDVILGWGFLSQFSFQVDYPNRRFRWGAPFSPRPDDLVLPLQVVNRVPVVRGQVDGKEHAFLFDTGAPICLLGPASAPGVLINAKTRGVLRLADLEVAVEFRVKDLAGRQFSAVIGNNLLLDYVVTFDPAAKQIRLSQGAAPPR